jgi:predicted alpha/beta-fold hydrolase
MTPSDPPIRRYSVPCSPPLWARGAHRQTLLGYGLAAPGEPLEAQADGSIDPVEIPLPDGDRLVVMDAAPLAPGRFDGAVCHLMHGLTGSSDSNYIRMVAAVLRRQGARVMAFNHRGQGPGAGLAKGLYHSGSFRDLWAAVGASRVRYPGLHQLCVGFSLSANTALLGITEKGIGLGEEVLPDAVLAVNPPVELRACAIAIETGFNKLYDRNFVRGLREALSVRQSRGWIPADITIPKGASVRGADEAMTAPLAGYGSADEYYADCSSGPRLGTLRRPAVILSSGDDPFIEAADIERAAMDTQVFVHIEPRGGHLGYLTRPSDVPSEFSSELPGLGRRWLPDAISHYLGELLARKSAGFSVIHVATEPG